MNIFVTVGTTPFNSLVKFVDGISNQKYDIKMQISNGTYKPENHSFFSFDKDIDKYYHDADVILTHAGAGSIYKLLEMNKKIIVFPNTDRQDLHQFDIARYVYINNYGLLGSLHKSLDLQIIKSYKAIFSQYRKVRFSASDVIEALKNG
ncbi:hypothetical protein BCU24_21110 [Vibrio cyclitrophicus]|uniref:PssE/Cps14G family polysaccharide biosynthesis glycosyltransferase n=1 Tax=Vibrio cyclitrophicus TaxID=47951 RepID=UPI000C851EAB|nr:PssE/Cps14G family polysaccharide biosynthesis glycosyltransferase [Vibrio cyclitrophicus]PMJ21408.1 hypothetical protein BCU28_10470 [Vibrio cyclitrophicus]PMJ38246.1 hypothetical protein BCU24_21110 [Vibrio cyclitrophicus]